MPMLHIGTQRIPDGLGITPWLGGQHLDALGEQHGRLTLHLYPMLQVFNHLDAVCQLHLDRRKWFFAQWCTGFCGIALPGQGISNIEFGQVQQRLGFLRPLRRQHFLPFGALDVVELFAQQFGSALVFGTQLPEDILQLLC